VSAAPRQRWRRLRGRLAPTRTAELARAIPAGASVLDVGCGNASPLVQLRQRLSLLGGVDAFATALEHARQSGVYDVLVEGPVQDLERLFGAGSYDVVAAIDLLEHLDAADGGRLLDEMERIARRRVVVVTPNGFVPQDALEGNPWQVHRSGWTPDELRARGYAVRGLHGLRILRAEEAQIRFRPRRAWSLVSDLTAPIARAAPTLAYHLLATKEIT
jgi:SAM-dependent methyltransferase